MLRQLTELRGFDIHARDGEIGDAADFLFDDRKWKLRYLTVDTGNWMPGRKVLIAPEAISGVEWSDKALRVDLSKEQIENSPGVASDRPVSANEEKTLRDHYGWPDYWSSLGIGLAGAAVPGVPTQPDGAATEAESGSGAARETGDPHLRSVNEVVGYHIKASDGEIGHIDDMMAEEGDWTVRYLVVDTRNWLPGRKVLVSPDWVEDFSWANRIASVDMPRDRIKKSPEYDPDKKLQREDEQALFDYYALMPYWARP